MFESRGMVRAAAGGDGAAAVAWPVAAEAAAAYTAASCADLAGRVGAADADADWAGLVAVAEAVIERLAGQTLGAAVDDAAVADSVERLARLERRVAAEKLRRIGEVDRREAYRSQGHASTEELLADRLALTRSEAKGQAETARVLPTLPRTAGKLAAGELGVEQVAVAAQTAADVPADTLDELDELVADHCDGLHRRAVRDTVQRWRHTVDERWLADREARAWRRRAAWVRADTRDGMVTGGFRLDPVGGATVIAALEALARPAGKHDQRTRDQRVADALVDVCNRQLDGGQLPDVAAQRPHLLAITTNETLDGADDAPSHLDGVGPVSPATARMLACDGEVTEIVVDARGRPLQVRETGKPTRRQRLAVIARDQRCIGCHAPAAACQIHHIVWRRRHGATVVDNLTLACHSCHRNIHHHGWTVTRKRGRYRLQPPHPHRPPP